MYTGSAVQALSCGGNTLLPVCGVVLLRVLLLQMFRPFSPVLRTGLYSVRHAPELQRLVISTICNGIFNTGSFMSITSGNGCLKHLVESASNTWSLLGSGAPCGTPH